MVQSLTAKLPDSARLVQKWSEQETLRNADLDYTWGLIITHTVRFRRQLPI
jgi:hypothetical protein